MMTVKKDAHLNVRLTKHERAAIASRARSAGLTSSAYVRKRALTDDNRPVIKVDANQLKAIYRTLRLSASNLNQCTRELNTRHKPNEIEKELSLAFKSLELTTSELADFIRNVKNSS